MPPTALPHMTNKCIHVLEQFASSRSLVTTQKFTHCCHTYVGHGMRWKNGVEVEITANDRTKTSRTDGWRERSHTIGTARTMGDMF